MDSVGLDVFSLQPCTYQGQDIDALVVCVDRQSGWMIAMPTTKEGLTANKVAHYIVHQWDMFGIPSVITSNKVPNLQESGGKRSARGWAFAMPTDRHIELRPMERQNQPDHRHSTEVACGRGIN